MARPGTEPGIWYLPLLIKTAELQIRWGIEDNSEIIFFIFLNVNICCDLIRKSLDVMVLMTVHKILCYPFLPGALRVRHYRLCYGAQSEGKNKSVPELQKSPSSTGPLSQ